MVDHIYNVLKNYSINVENIDDVTGNVYKIHDSERTYALKKSSLTEENVQQWLSVLKTAHDYQIENILPVYRTKEGNLYCKMNNHVYYMTPWIDNTHISIEKLFQCIGRIHKKTKITIQASLDTFEDAFVQYKNYCQTVREKMVRYVERFEQKHYMSPVELQICTHFRDVDHCLYLVIKFIDKFLNTMKDNLEWSISLCHGNLISNHFLTSDVMYLINWERSYYDHSAYDLVHYVNHMKENLSKEMLEKSFQAYFLENKWEEKDLYFYGIQLLQPKRYFSLVQAYSIQSWNDSTIRQVQQLEIEYRKLVFGLYSYQLMEKGWGEVNKDHA